MRATGGFCETPQSDRQFVAPEGGPALGASVRVKKGGRSGRRAGCAKGNETDGRRLLSFEGPAPRVSVYVSVR